MGSVTGTVRSIDDVGTIVIVHVFNASADEMYRINFDHRMFHHLVEGRGGLQYVLNQPVVIDHYPSFDETLTFLDDIEKVL